MKVDAPRRTLWVTTSGIANMRGFQPEDEGRTALVVFDLDKGHVTGRWEPPATEQGYRLNDLAIAQDGSIYATDNMLGGGVYHLASGAQHLVRIDRPGQLRSPQGVVLAGDGKRLYVADYSFGVVSLDLASGTARALEEPANTQLIGIDGLATYEGDLIAIQNGVAPRRILRLELDDTGWRIERAAILLMSDPRWDEPTLGLVVHGEEMLSSEESREDAFYYVANSQWGRFDAEGRLAPLDELSEPLILKYAL